MSVFVPPRPTVTDKRASPVARARQFLNSGLSLFLRGSYDFVGVSRHPLPRIPFRPKRVVYLARRPEAIRQVLVSDAARYPKAHLMDSMLRALTGVRVRRNTRRSCQSSVVSMSRRGLLAVST